MQRDRAFWEQVVSEYDSKGAITKSKFCALRDIKSPTLDYWRRKLRTEHKPTSSAGFVRIGTQSSEELCPQNKNQLRIRVRNNLVLELPLSLDYNQLVTILQAAAAL